MRIRGVIRGASDDFILRIKERGDIEIHEVTEETRDSLPDLIIERIAQFLKQTILP